jgi:hypothetical protein
LTFVAYGFAPSTTVHIDLSAGGYASNTTQVADAYGVTWSDAEVTRGWPATGTYTITVSDGSRTVTATTTLSATTITDRGPLTRRHQLLTVRR